MAETNNRNGRLNGYAPTVKWVAIIIATIMAVMGWSRNYGLQTEVARNCLTIKENAVTIADLRASAARDRAILERIETDIRDIKAILQER